MTGSFPGGHYAARFGARHSWAGSVDNSFTPYPANRIPAAVGDAIDPVNHENDTVFPAFRVTIAPEPGVLAMIGLSVTAMGLRRRTGKSIGLG